ncbi:MAG: TatD family hydrolase, partial [Selenomonadaceae bacterium]|nr:TatD family hydrolase [Selenomonadaceae bacterium]
MNNKNNFVDTHCHLNDKQFADDLDDVIARANLVGVNRIINFGATL